MQEGRPVAYYLKKLDPAQRNYTTREKELLAIVMVLNDFHSMLLGADITIFTDHINLTYNNFSTQRVMRWWFYGEENAPKLEYIKGKLNVLTSAFSQLPKFEDVGFDSKSEHVPIPTNTSMYLLDEAFWDQRFTSDETFIYDDSFIYNDVLHTINDRDLFHCLQGYGDDPTTMSYVNLPAIVKNPLNLKWLRAAQDSHQGLQL